MVRFLLAFTALAFTALAQTAPYNFNEAKIPPYTLPDPLTLSNGLKVTDSKTWLEKRRPELLTLFADQVYGHGPAESAPLRASEVFTDRKALNGKAIRKQVTLYFTEDNAGPQMHVLLYLPAAAKSPSPVFVALSFNGNHTVDKDPGIAANEVWLRDPNDISGSPNRKWVHLLPDDRTRGQFAANWQVEKLLDRGYGLAVVYYYDIEPDFVGGMQYGVRPLLVRDPDSWSALGAWAWGLSRTVDWLFTDRAVDQRRIALMGHSRLGKAALWAAAQDPRFALVVSNESGKGGASLLKRGYGETTDHLNTAFPHWFGPNYKQYTGHPEKLPVDGHELLALIAPRPLYVASAVDDQGSDPKGEFLSAVNAGKVYQLFGKKGLGVTLMPLPDQPVMHDIGYHVRTGKHDVTAFDWDQYLAFADLHWGANQTPKPAPAKPETRRP